MLFFGQQPLVKKRIQLHSECGFTRRFELGLDDAIGGAQYGCFEFRGPSASTCPYPDDEIIGGDSVKSIRGRLLASEAMPSAEEIRFSYIEAEDHFEAKVDIIRQMASLDPEGDWECGGACALDNPRTKTGEESLGKLRDICDKLRLHDQLLKVFRRRDEDAGPEA
ncbi:hypothetical protein PIB30_090742 [Stylosanthes scabra]|uniref:DUF8018 domain-containing protein n=1 Tax=Stylosanthes scabra TaxID=79078 RepID=A0ABU6XU17_9FABA|nr:hypothetical protein [Stylosanthes scabra]